ncbi:MAG: ISAs1 family transposase [Chloroflexales bacterium]|nr:ISAs1 family transposase [Chloroflexales bacterium]
MSDGPVASIATHFGHLRAPRVARTRAHNLLAILTIAMCAILAGAAGPTGMETFGPAQEAGLRTLLPWPNGIPAHATCSRGLVQLKPAERQQGFLDWFAAIQTVTQGELDALDGKTLRQSAATAWGQAAVPMVGAWASANWLVLGPEKGAPDANAITAVPALLEQLALHRCLVTVDALHCQVKTTETMVKGEADDVIAAKGNPEPLHAALRAAFAAAHANDFADVAHDTYQTAEPRHGRWERRTYWTLMAPLVLARVHPQGRWPKLGCIGMVRAERTLNGKPSSEARFSISRLAGNARTFGRTVRGHWGIEHAAPWLLDLVFRSPHLLRQSVLSTLAWL